MVKSQKVLGAKSYVCRKCRGKTGWFFCPPAILNRIKIKSKPIFASVLLLSTEHLFSAEVALSRASQINRQKNTLEHLNYKAAPNGCFKKTVDEEFHPAKSGACGYYLKRIPEPKFMLFD